MQIIQAKFEILDQKPGIQGIYEQAELPGRICYHSQDKIAPGSAEKFIKNLMNSNHGAPLEHNGVYLDCPEMVYQKYCNNEYSKTSYYKTGETIKVPIKGYVEEITKYYVSTNLRVLFENGWLEDLQYLCEPTEYHEKRITVKFTVDRFTGEEFLRHRKGSFNRESTRYVNFSKEKFGDGDIKFIFPCWVEDDIKPITEEEYRNYCRAIYYGEDYDDFSAIDYWVFSLKTAEYCYNNLTRLGWQAQQARTVLPCAIDSPLIMTAFVSDWVHFFNLRALGTTGNPHPQAKQLAWPLMKEFESRGLIKIEYNEEDVKKSVISKV